MWSNKMSHAIVTLSTDVNIEATITQPTQTLFTMSPGASLIRNFNGDLWKIDSKGTRIGRIQFDHSEYTGALAADNTAALVINTSTDVDDNVPIDELRSYGNDYAAGDAVRGAVVRFDADASGNDDFYFNHWKKIIANFSKYLFYWNVTQATGTAGIKGNVFGPILIDRIPYLWYDDLDGVTTCKLLDNYFGPIIYEGGNNADYLPGAGLSIFEFDGGATETIAGNMFYGSFYDVNTGTLFGNMEGTGEKNTAFIGTIGESYIGEFKGQLNWLDSSVPANIFTLSFADESLVDNDAQNAHPVGKLGQAQGVVVPFACYVYGIGMGTRGIAATNGTIRIHNTDGHPIDHTFTLTLGTTAYNIVFAYSTAIGYDFSAGDQIVLRITTANLNTAAEDIYITLYLVPMKG
jgi:hypothetical protein